jgi:hypothetical protein
MATGHMVRLAMRSIVQRRRCVPSHHEEFMAAATDRQRRPMLVSRAQIARHIARQYSARMRARA